MLFPLLVHYVESTEVIGLIPYLGPEFIEAIRSTKALPLLMLCGRKYCLTKRQLKKENL
jgi:hypothetical protein